MRIIDPGLLTTVQDLGRFGSQKDGITPSGAMDPVALRVANALVGNPEGAAALEITLSGPTIRFLQDALVALCGADISPTIADVVIPLWRAVFVQEGSVLAFGKARWGCRCYLAIAGGVDVPPVMGSRSTYIRAGIGGLQGRPLKSGDELPTGRASQDSMKAMREAAENLGPLPLAMTDRRADQVAASLYDLDAPVRFVEGPHLELFDDRDRRALVKEVFEVSPRSDRMGYRLSGAVLKSGERDELASTAVLAGTVQVPPGGEPIVLMADRQTTGGYPMIAQVVTAHLPVLAQLRPGDRLRFAEATIGEAQSALRAREKVLRDLTSVLC